MLWADKVVTCFLAVPYKISYHEKLYLPKVYELCFQEQVCDVCTTPHRQGL